MSDDIATAKKLLEHLFTEEEIKEVESLDGKSYDSMSETQLDLVLRFNDAFQNVIEQRQMKESNE